MKPWVGAVAVAAAILAAPSVALAGEDDPAQLQFKLPSAEAVHDFETLGLSMDHDIDAQCGRHRRRQRVGHGRAGRTRARRTATSVVGTITSKFAIDAHPRRAQTRRSKKIKARQATRCVRTPASRARAPAPLPAASTPSARTTTRTTSAASSRSRPTPTALTSPAPTATPTSARPSRPSGSTPPATASAGGQPSASTPTPTSARTTTSTTTRSSGSATRATARRHARHRQGRVLERRRRHARRQGVDRARTRPSRPPRLRPASSRTTTTRKRRTEDARPRHRVPEHLRGHQAAGARRAATSAGRRRCSATRTRRAPGRPRPSPYVRFDANNLPVAGSSPTTRPAGQHGRPDLEEHGPPGRQQPRGADRRPGGRGQPGAERQPHRQRDPHQPGDQRPAARSRARRRRSSPRSTPTRRSRTWSPRRRGARTTGAGVVQPGARLAAERPAARAGDGPARPAGPVHAAHRQAARRLQGRRVPLLPGARQRDRDLGRLPRDRGAPRAQLRDRCPRRRRWSTTSTSSSSRRSTATARRTRCMTPTAARTCPTTARTRPSSRATTTDPAQRNSWGVDMNRNFQDGSVFDGFQGASATDCLERQLRRPLRALRARGPQRDLGADDVPQHQVRQQHPLVRWPTSCGRPAPTRRRACRCRTRRTAR